MAENTMLLNYSMRNREEDIAILVQGKVSSEKFINKNARYKSGIVIR